jgi:hypothetical protein
LLFRGEFSLQEELELALPFLATHIAYVSDQKIRVLTQRPDLRRVLEKESFSKRVSRKRLGPHSVCVACDTAPLPKATYKRAWE